MNPEIENIPNIGSVKRSIEHQNYLYNQEQLQRKREILKRQKQQEILQTTIQNHQALIELENQKARSLRKKFYVQNTLQKQYDQQIDTRQRVKTQQKSKQKIYSYLEKQLLQNQQKSRIFEMTKLYQIGPNQKKQTQTYFRQKRILTQPCEDSLDYLRNKSVNDFRTEKQSKSPQIKIEPQYSAQVSIVPNSQQTPKSDIFLQNKKQHASKTETPIHYKNSLPYLEQSTTPLKNSNQKKYSMFNVDYADYLKKQIDRKQKQKEIQKRKELEKDKSWIENQNHSYYQSVEQMKFINQKKKHDLASGLEKQLQWKKIYKGF